MDEKARDSNFGSLLHWIIKIKGNLQPQLQIAAKWELHHHCFCRRIDLKKKRLEFQLVPNYGEPYPHKAPICQCKSGNWIVNYPICTDKWGVCRWEIRAHSWNFGLKQWNHMLLSAAKLIRIMFISARVSPHVFSLEPDVYWVKA